MSLLDDLVSGDGLSSIHGIIWVGLGVWALVGTLFYIPAKRKQDKRIDLPTVGYSTFLQCHKSGLKGIVLKSKKNIFLDKSNSSSAKALRKVEKTLPISSLYT